MGFTSLTTGNCMQRIGVDACWVPRHGRGCLVRCICRTCSMSIHLLNIDESRETKRVWNLSGMGVLRVCWQYRNLSLLQLSMSAGWSLDNCGKGGCVLKLVKDAILLAFYDILTQNLPSIMWNFAQPFYFSYWEFIRGIWLLSLIILHYMFCGLWPGNKKGRARAVTDRNRAPLNQMKAKVKAWDGFKNFDVIMVEKE